MKKYLFILIITATSFSTQAQELQIEMNNQLIRRVASGVFANVKELFLKSQDHSEYDFLESEAEEFCENPSMIPGGWMSFPLACQTYVGEVEVALDKGFKLVFAKFPIVQKGAFRINDQGELEYYLLLKLAGIKLKPEKVQWAPDRSYRIGEKIEGLCVPDEFRGNESILCTAGFHGLHGIIVGGYEETYYGDDLEKIILIGAPSLAGNDPLFPWRATLKRGK